MSPEPVSSLADRIGIARRLRGLTQQQLAQQADVPQAQVSRIERGDISEPAFNTIVKLASALQISLDGLATPSANKFLSEFSEDIRSNEATATRSIFMKMAPQFPVLIEDPYSPPAGYIPLGNLATKNEEAKYIGMVAANGSGNSLVIGSTGTGKSEFLKWQIVGNAKAGYPIVVIDPHGALAEDVLNALVKNVPERKDDIVFLDTSDKDHSLSINPLDVKTREDIEPAVHAIIEMLNVQMNLSSAGAPRAINLANQALQALCEANLLIEDEQAKCNLLHLVTFFIDVEFRRLIIEQCSNISVKETFDAERGPYELLSEKQQVDFAMPIIRAIQPFASSESLSSVFSSSKNKLDFPALMNDNKIIIIKLARFSHQRKLGELLGALFLPWMLSSDEQWGKTHHYNDEGEEPQAQGRGGRIFIDEAPMLVGPNSSVMGMLGELRKLDIGITFSMQYLGQLDKHSVEKLIAGVSNKFIFAMDPSSAVQISRSLASGDRVVKPTDISDLPDYHYYACTLPNDSNASERHDVFSAAALPVINQGLDDAEKIVREQIRASSRALLALDATVEVASRLDRIKQVLGELLIARIGKLIDDDEGIAGRDSDWTKW